jgi:hypothetical protein
MIASDADWIESKVGRGSPNFRDCAGALTAIYRAALALGQAGAEQVSETYGGSSGQP